MSSLSMELPRAVFIERGILEQLGDISKRYSLGSSALIVSGPRTVKIAGDRAAEILSDSGIATEIKIIDVPEKTLLDGLVEESKKFSFVIGVGGGKAIDTAKYVSLKHSLPSMSIPTSLSNDGIASPRITLNNNGFHYSKHGRPPTVVLVDTGIVSTTPDRYLVSGYGDTISNLSAVKDWRLAHKDIGEAYSLPAACTAETAAIHVLDNAEEIRKKSDVGIRVLAESLVNAGIAMCMAGSSRPASGSEHLFSHALDSVNPDKNCLHGEQVGVGSIIANYLHGDDWEKVKNKLLNLSCPINSEQLGVEPKDIVKAIVLAKGIRNRYTILDKLNLNEGEAEKIATETGVI